MYLCILDHPGNVVFHKEVPAEPVAFLEAIAPLRDGWFGGPEVADQHDPGHRLRICRLRLGSPQPDGDNQSGNGKDEANHCYLLEQGPYEAEQKGTSSGNPWRRDRIVFNPAPSATCRTAGQSCGGAAGLGSKSRRSDPPTVPDFHRSPAVQQISPV